MGVEGGGRSEPHVKNKHNNRPENPAGGIKLSNIQRHAAQNAYPGLSRRLSWNAYTPGKTGAAYTIP